jgi:hypothetical protein
MIKGWKNNPLWVQHYAEVKKDKLKRHLNKITFEREAEQRSLEIEHIMQRSKMARKPLARLI